MAVKRPRKPPKTAAQLGIRSKTKRLGPTMLKGGAPPVASAAFRGDRPGHTKKVARPSGKTARGSARVRGATGNIIKGADSDPGSKANPSSKPNPRLPGPAGAYKTKKRRKR